MYTTLSLSRSTRSYSEAYVYIAHTETYMYMNPYRHTVDRHHWLAEMIWLPYVFVHDSGEQMRFSQSLLI